MFYNLPRFGNVDWHGSGRCHQSGDHAGQEVKHDALLDETLKKLTF